MKKHFALYLLKEFLNRGTDGGKHYGNRNNFDFQMPGFLKGKFKYFMIGGALLVTLIFIVGGIAVYLVGGFIWGLFASPATGQIASDTFTHGQQTLQAATSSGCWQQVTGLIDLNLWNQQPLGVIFGNLWDACISGTPVERPLTEAPKEYFALREI